MDITDITFVFIFLSGFGFEYGYWPCSLVFSAGIVFFSHDKSAGTVLRLVFFFQRSERGQEVCHSSRGIA